MAESKVQSDYQNAITAITDNVINPFGGKLNVSYVDNLLAFNYVYNGHTYTIECSDSNISYYIDSVRKWQK